MADFKLIKRVHFSSVDRKPALPQRRLLKRFLATIFRRENHTLDQLTVIFCSDEYLLGINQQYLHHDEFTDIITFDLSTQSDKVEGEIYISLDRIAENAKIFGVGSLNELLRVIFHGVLHLCGYQDKSPSQKKQMRAKEDQYLASYHRFVSRENRST